jgi:anthranilate/para-aminobenzoate synthase component I
MRKLAVLFFIVLLGCVFSLQASEVAEVAKKEKARRNALNHEGKTAAKTFTNADVVNIKSQLSFEVKSEPAATNKDDFAQAQEATNAAAKELGQKVENEQANQQAEEQKQQLTQERNEYEQKAKDAQETINQGGGYFTRNIGNQFQQKREAEEKIREIDGKLSEQKESENNNEEQPQ